MKIAEIGVLGLERARAHVQNRGARALVGGCQSELDAVRSEAPSRATYRVVVGGFAVAS